jgi:hypothetical protein
MMSKGPLEKRERLSRLCKSIIDNPRNVDGDVTAQFKAAALRYAHTFYDEPTQVLKRIYCDEGELGDLMRGAVDVVSKQRDDQNFRSTATGALYPKSPRSFNDIMDDLDADDDGDAIDRDRELLGENDDDAELDEVITKALRDHHQGHHSLSAALVQHLHDRLARRRERHGYRKRKESSPMDRTTELRAIAKAGGIIAVAKTIIDENRSYGISEHEFVELATEHAKAAHPELTEAAAFAKIYQIPEVWRACNLLKSMPFHADVTPVMVGGEDTRDLSDTSKAIAQLKQLGARKWPTATEAQQFANAFTDPVNATLAAKAHRRPTAPAGGIYPYPR